MLWGKSFNKIFLTSVILEVHFEPLHHCYFRQMDRGCVFYSSTVDEIASPVSEHVLVFIFGYQLACKPGAPEHEYSLRSREASR